ncbi:MAG: DHH family phosphoesterase [Candidatus Woesearchaeota archaeon]
MSDKEFMVKSNVLERLRPRINKAISLIKQAIEAKRPIWIRHHSDVDGYCAGVAIERAILPLIYDRHTKERDTFYSYARMPSKAPYYDYTDATKDLTNFMNRMNKFEAKAPMIIICDNGSSEQDIMAIKKVRIYGAKVIVIDHHPLCDEIDNITDAHINPHQIKSVYDLSAGMLCAEIAKQINPEIDQMEFFAAVAGFADKVKSKEFEQYVELCKKKGGSQELIKDTAECLDFETFVLGFIESRDLINDILGGDHNKQKKLINLIKPKANELKKQQLETNKKYMKIEEKDNIIICKLPIDQVRSMGSFPPSGKTTGIIHDYIKEKYKNKFVISLGISNGQINFRCSNEIKNFDVNEIIALLKKKMPYAQIDGGGHRVAGSISFIEAAKEEVLDFVDEYIDSIKC